MNLMKQVYDIGYFFRTVEFQLRFGHLSRAPLRLLRLEVRNEVAECDWVSRPADPWDAHIPRQASDANVSAQALQDAIAVRELLFSALPGIELASLRVFRESIAGEHELIITGSVERRQESSRYVASVVMRAKLLGFQFRLEDGILEPLRSEEFAMTY